MITGARSREARCLSPRRDEVVVANKLWWEFWPEQNATAELDASLRRMGFDYVDLTAQPCRNLALWLYLRQVARAWDGCGSPWLLK